MFFTRNRATMIGSLLASALVLQGCNTTSQTDNTRQQTEVDKAIGKCVASIAVGAIGGAIIGAAFGGNSAARQGAVAGALIGVGRCAVLVELAAEQDRRQLRQAQLAALESDETVYGSFTTESGKIAQVTTRSTPAPPPEPQVRKKKVTKPKEQVKKAAPETTNAQAPEVAKQSAESAAESARQVAEYDENPDVKIITDADQPQEAQLAVLENGNSAGDNASEPAFLEETADTMVCKYTEMVINMQGQSADGGRQKWCRAGDGAWEPVTG